MKKDLYVYVPGLGGESILQKQREVIDSWQHDRLDTAFLEPQWMNKSETFDDKVKRLLTDCSQLKLKKYKTVCLVGTSAGGTLGLNLFYELGKKHKNIKFISICGKITGSNAIGPQFSVPHPALIPSVVHSEKLIKQLTPQQKQNIQTVTPLFDEVVFKRFMKIEGVKNKRIFTVGHIISIYHAIKTPRIIDKFVKK